MEKFLKPKKINVSAGSSIGHVECPDDIGIFCSGPVQPQIGVTFPIDSDGRTLSPEWYRRFTWLEYSQKRDAAFCYACRHFAPSSLNNATFALKGYRGWKRALGDKNRIALSRRHSSRSCLDGRSVSNELVLRIL